MNNPFRNQGQTNGSFLPMDYVARKAEIRANIIVLSLFALVMAGVIGAFLLLVRTTHSLKDRETRVTEASAAEAAKLEQVRTLMSQRAQLLEKADITAALVERIPRWALLGDIVLRMPKDVRLSQFALKGKRVEPPPPPPLANGKPAPKVRTLTGAQAQAENPAKPAKVSAPQFEYTITMVGAAEKNNDVADFLELLKQSPILTNVEMQYIRESKEKEQIFRKFEISASLTKRPDTEKIAEALRGLMAQAKGGGAPVAKTPDGAKPDPAKKANPVNTAIKALTKTLSTPAKPSKPSKSAGAGAKEGN